MLSLMIASGSSSMAFRSKWTFSATCSSSAPGAQRWGRIHSERVVGGTVIPPVSSSATVGSQ